MPFKRVSKGVYEYLLGRPAVRQSLYINFRGIDGKPRKEKINTMSVPEAKKLLADKKYEINMAKKRLAREGKQATQIINYKKLRLDDMAKLYFDARRTKLNEDDRKKYNTRIHPTLGSKLVSKITIDDIQKLQDLLEPHYAPKTLNETINSLRAMFNQGIKKKWCDYNPVNRDEIKNIEVNAEPGRVLTNLELTQMFDTLKNGNTELSINPNPTLYFYTKLSYFTGTRPTAIMDLQVKHINFHENKVHLKAMKKGKSYQQKLRVEVMNLIRDWIALHELKHSDYLFYPQQLFQRSQDPNDKCIPMNYSVIAKSAKKVFDKLFNKNIPSNDLAYKVTLYSLRRTAGTNRYKSKGLVSAKNFLNHTNVQTTMTYLNVTDDFQEDDDDGL